ncbi:hypothetical protein Bbelb_236830 [Branchiostoma belcheri]|nr:hypothetical protein Bbelb_236830 [Branchiostoma belcheri]
MSETVTVTETQPANADDFDDFEKALDSLIEEDDKKVDNKEASEEEITEDKIDKELEENEKEGQKEPEKTEEKPEEVRAETPSGEKSDEDDYAITDEQRAAELALQQMKESLEYNDDDTLMDGDPPEYNVKERLKELNEELAKEPLVEEESRERKVLFKENLVDLEVPPPEYSDEEADGAAKTDTTENVAEDVKDKLTLSESEASSTENNAEANTTDESNKGEENGDGERVLVEREGKFELVHVSELQGEEEKIQQSFAPVTTAENNDTTQDTDEADNDSSSTQRSQETNELLPRPPDKPRPATAAGVSRRPAKVSTPQRAQSASYTREEYAWLAQKRDQHRREKEELRRKKQLEQADQHGVSRDGKQSVPPGVSEGTDEDDDDPQEAYQEWLKAKRDQRKKEREIEEQRKREQEEGFYLRAREDCDKAYKQKSQELSQAIRQAQAFRYVDYYGYRF